MTGDIYVALLYQENAIEGLNIELTSNGIYTQLGLAGENVSIQYSITSTINLQMRYWKA